MNIIEQLENITPYNGRPVEVVDKKWLISFNGYKKKKQNFNTYYQFDPLAIVYCESPEQVSEVVQLAGKENRILRVRSGGHDHEAECSATGAIVIDLSKMKHVSFDKATKIAEIEPGARFEDIVRILSAYDVSIPHGTCPSVAIAGFISGGGWGPWTRSKGMCCESLVAVSIVLGNGEIAYLDERTQRGRELLWAIRGGGGMSYGIITKFYIETFPLPDELIKFELTFKGRFKSMDVFKVWEDMIAPSNNPELTGTNIKIKARNPEDKDSIEECVIYGSFAESSETFKTKLKVWLKPLETDESFLEEYLKIEEIREKGKQIAGQIFFEELYVNWELGQAKLRGGTPSPHKVTSRVVVEDGWGASGRQNLYESLNTCILPTSQELKDSGIECYATHNAISGAYYANHKAAGTGNTESSFPYKQRPFIIQYQAWWKLEGNIPEAKFKKCLNSVLEWQQECRDRSFPETSGSFISFKDASIMTKHYFAESYEELKRIKEKWSNDPENIFSSRKTII
ncbi:hypothetical protein ACM46_15130 [Chryseobacterium angstadtii]|uniref:FAD-binding PCMH-type domain-containing protein n=1 Tax=Chryseobacterium angstadtii TaxID=558151 RepID=A0A0J7I4T4_9FLAO|nr:FAD-dependent oxidoreductase [Chryseobacterium angstadtii]KMQ61362.1 hypothetical protein ACM46_15130 [Chryseobacterium angstadtii]